MTSMINQWLKDLWRGAGYLPRGVLLLRNPAIRPFVVLPLLVNTLLFAGLMLYLFWRFDSWLGWWLGWLPVWIFDWLKWLLIPFFFFAIQGVVVFFFSLMANLLCGSFNDLLAERVEVTITGIPPPVSGGMVQAWRDFFPALLGEVKKTVYSLVWAGPLTLLLFIPGVKLVVLPFWFVHSAWLLALHYADFPMANHGIPAVRMRQLLWQKPWLTIGFGMVTLLCSTIPVVNFLVIPAAVAGATLLWTEMYLKQEVA